MQSAPSSLPDIEAACWAELQAATRDKRHAWRTPVLATVDGERADARIVVLREVDAEQRQLLMYTDSRAGKVPQIVRHPIGTLVFWSAPLGWQLRAEVELSVQDSGLDVASRWARVKLSPSAQDYLAPLPPGTPLQGAPAEPERGSLGNFAVITAALRSIDWLELKAGVNRRARFDEAGARWLQA